MEIMEDKKVFLDTNILIYAKLEESIFHKAAIDKLNEFMANEFELKQTHDANIVATMRAYDIENLFTNNPDDFNRYKNFIKIIPLDSVLK